MKSTQIASQNTIKQINKSIVFETIKTKGPVYRSKISKETGLNKATVSTMVAELIEVSFVHEIGVGQSSGGRKPVMLYFNHHAGYSIGIDLGVNYVLGILTDLNGNKMERKLNMLPSTEWNVVIKQLNATIESLMELAPHSPYGIIGIGIGVPGQIDQDNNILFAPNLKWSNVNLKKAIEDEFQIPAIIENEANAGAHGEQLYGAGKNITNQIYVSIGIGIGTGIIINHQLYKGTSGISGEMGHFSIDANGKKCSCGSRGCWELYASEGALLAAVDRTNITADSQSVDLDFLLRKAKEGYPSVLQLLNTLGENIGIGLVNIVNTFNPGVIIIGNRIAQFENWIMNPIERILGERLSIDHKANTAIRFSVLGKDAIASGVNAFAITDFFSSHKVKDGD